MLLQHCISLLSVDRMIHNRFVTLGHRSINTTACERFETNLQIRSRDRQATGTPMTTSEFEKLDWTTKAVGLQTSTLVASALRSYTSILVRCRRTFHLLGMTSTYCQPHPARRVCSERGSTKKCLQCDRILVRI